MNIQFRTATDPIFTESLTKANMAKYYQTRNIVWDHDLFVSSWDQMDNYEVHTNETRIGVIRFSYDESRTFLRDLQLSTEFQGQGLGSKCLDLIVLHAKQRKSAQLVLRVFSENPAINLYQTKGFTQVSEVNGLIAMELTLDSNT